MKVVFHSVDTIKITFVVFNNSPNIFIELVGVRF